MPLVPNMGTSPSCLRGAVGITGQPGRKGTGEEKEEEDPAFVTDARLLPRDRPRRGATGAAPGHG